MSGVKFFKCIENLEIEFDGTSNASLVASVLDYDKKKYWRSIGSTDAKEEAITLALKNEAELDTILIIGHNLKNFSILIHLSNGSIVDTFQSFNDVVCGNSISSNSIATSYFKFKPQSVSKIEIKMLNTFTEDKEKKIERIVLTKEVGQLKGFPSLDTEINESFTKYRLLSGKYKVFKKDEVFSASIIFKNYPIFEDIELMYSLASESFFIWPCGGKIGSDYFKCNIRSYRPEDLYKVSISDNVQESFDKNIYTSNVNLVVKVVETI
ncbi:MAG: hypothetical protein HQK52_19475 [Oligoflexia bacterium]|nr:hypothetical protein [Oligoflexia bacterium]